MSSHGMESATSLHCMGKVNYFNRRFHFLPGDKRMVFLSGPTSGAFGAYIAYGLKQRQF